MHPNPRRVLPIVLLVVLLGGAYYWWTTQPVAADTALNVSGTIEADHVTIAADVMGRVLTVAVDEGDSVTAGQTLVTLDASLLEAQRRQAEAALSATQGTHAAAEAALAAAQANYDLLAAGPTKEQLDVVESAVKRAEAAVDAANAVVDALPDTTKGTSQAQQLTQQVDIAEATLENARAQQAQLQAGARPEQLDAAQAQIDAATAQIAATQGQVEAAQAALAVLDVQMGRLTLTAPSNGVVLTRPIEPGEIASVGGALLEIADLSQLTLTVYVPEDRYGQLSVGDTATVTVDSFPGVSFAATVSRIADQAEFTPRNVQTSEGRRLTVYAVALRLNNPDGRLKPGMPADIVFAE